MKCKCIHCEEEYENNRDFKTSICNECFKRFNENQLQPLKDEIRNIKQRTERRIQILEEKLEKAR